LRTAKSGPLEDPHGETSYSHNSHTPDACGPEAKGPSEGDAFSGLRSGNMKNIQLETIETTQANEKTKKRHHLLLNDPDVDRWYRKLRTDSPNTSSVRLRRLGLFCEENSTTPRKLAAMKPRIVTELLEDYVSRKAECTYKRDDGTEAKYQRDYIKTTIVTVKSWLDHMGVKPTRDVRVKGADISRVQQEETISPEDVAGMMTRGSLKARAIKQLQAKRGLRPGVIGNKEGTEGLVLGDLPDLVLTSSGATFNKRPPRLVIRPTLSKTKLRGEGFLTSEAAKAILALTNDRLAKGEALSRESPLIPPSTTIAKRFRRDVPRKFMTSAAVSKEVRESNRPTYKQRPYALRVFAEQALLTAESRAGVPRTFWKHWQNQKGDIEARYTVNRPLPDDVLDAMRAMFLKAEPYLDVEVGSEVEDEKNKAKARAELESMDRDEVAKFLEERTRRPGSGPTSLFIGRGGASNLGGVDLHRNSSDWQSGPSEGCPEPKGSGPGGIRTHGL
jgi:hypothetical protein